MFLIEKNIQQMPLAELENRSESVWAKIKVGGIQHYIGCWYREPQARAEDINQLREQMEKITEMSKNKKLPKIHILGDFNYRNIAWPQKLHKEGRMLYPSEGQTLINIMEDHALEQLVNFPTREGNILDLILTSTPDSIENIESPNKFSDHSAIGCDIILCAPRKENKKRTVHRYNKGNFKSMRWEAVDFACSEYFNGEENNRDVEKNLDMIASFIHETVKKTYP